MKIKERDILCFCGMYVGIPCMYWAQSKMSLSFIDYVNW